MDHEQKYWEGPGQHRQPDWQWQYQLKHERDVTAQAEAALALEKYPTPSTRKILTDIIENEQCFYKVLTKMNSILVTVICLDNVLTTFVSF